MTAKIKAKDAERFKAAIAELNAVLTDVKKYAPNANYYLSMDTLNILDGDSHDAECNPRLDRVMCCDTIHTAGGGDW